MLGNYALQPVSPAVDHITCSSTANGCAVTGQTAGVRAPTADFFGHARPDSSNTIDVGAVEYKTNGASPFGVVSPSLLSFGNVAVNFPSASQTLTISNTGTNGALSTINFSISANFSRPAGAAGGSCAASGFSLPQGSSCTINVVFTPPAVQSYVGSVTFTAANGAVTGSPVTLTGTGVAASVTPASLTFNSVAVGSTSAAQTLTLQTSTALSAMSVVVTAPFARPAGAAGGTCSTSLAAAGSCTINVTFAPTAAGTVNGTVTINATGATITNNPVSLTGTAAQATVTPASLNFGNQAINTNSTTQNVTLTASVALNTIGFNFSSPVFTRVAPTTGTNCPATLAAGASCNIGVRFTPTALGPAVNTDGTTAALTITANAGTSAAAVTGSPVSLSGTGILGNVATLDNFNRTTSKTLGASWAQVVTSGVAAIHVQDVTGSSAGSGVALCDNTATPPACGPNGGFAYWNPTVFGNRQVARFTFFNTSGTFPADGSGVVLKATGGAASAPANFIQVQYANGLVSVSTTTNGGANYTTVGVVVVYGAGFQLNDTMTATVDATGLVTVWQNSTYLGSVQLPNVATWTTGGGRIGMLLAPNVEVDNFAGGNF
jgi:hypothetical protein